MGGKEIMIQNIPVKTATGVLKSIITKVYKYKIDLKIARKTLEITNQVTIRGDK